MLANLVLVCEDGLVVVVVALSSGSQATTVAELNPISCNSIPTKTGPLSLPGYPLAYQYISHITRSIGRNAKNTLIANDHVA